MMSDPSGMAPESVWDKRAATQTAAQQDANLDQAGEAAETMGYAALEFWNRRVGEAEWLGNALRDAGLSTEVGLASNWNAPPPEPLSLDAIKVDDIPEEAKTVADVYEVGSALVGGAGLVKGGIKLGARALGLIFKEASATRKVAKGSAKVVEEALGARPPGGREAVVVGRGALGREAGRDAMNSSLESGSEVIHGRTYTRIGSDEVSTRVARNVAPEEGLHDAVVHGKRTDDGSAMFSVDGQPTGSGQIGEAIAANPNYSGQPVRLMTCFGSCMAQDVSDYLGVRVRAANTRVLLPQQPNSVPLLEEGGFWRDFFPSKQGPR